MNQMAPHGSLLVLMGPYASILMGPNASFMAPHYDFSIIMGAHASL